MTKITKKNSIIYNQLWINKAIEEGHMDFIPIHKFPNRSIGEHIEIKYRQLENEEVNKLYHESLYKKDFSKLKRTNSKEVKITKKNSLLYELEWIAKYKEENIPLPSRTIQRQTSYSYGEILDLKYFERQLLKNNKTKRLLLIPGETINR